MGKNEVLSTDAAKERFALEPHMTPVGTIEPFGVVVHYRRFIALVTLAVTALGALYAYTRSPVYEANLLVQVADMRSAEPRSLLGEPRSGAAFKTAMSEVELLRSRAVVGAAVDRLGLNLSATPHYFPVIGAAIARWNTGRSTTPGGALGAYAWGAEVIRIGILQVPPSMEGSTLTVTKTGPGQYRIDDPQTGLSSPGRVGHFHEIAVGADRLTLRIDELRGARHVRYLIGRQNRIAVVEDLASSLEVNELGKETGMIRVSLRDTDPLRAKAILDEIGSAYMRLVHTQKGEADSESLAVLRAQLPSLEKRIAAAEARYESYRRRERAADLEEDTKLQLSRHSAAQTRMSELRQKRAELGVRLGDAHHEVIALDRQIAGASGESAQLVSGMRRLPGVGTELDRLARRLKADTELHASLLRKVEEMSLDVQDRSSNVRIVDEAVVPARPVGSKLGTVVFAGLLGLCLGTACAFVRRLRAAGRGKAETLFDADETVSDRPLHYA